MRIPCIVALLAAGCSDDPSAAAPGDIDGQNGACTAFEGRRFESVDKHECGLTPDGVALCYWHLELSALDPQRSNYSWQHSDVIESGSVRCTGSRISTDGIGPIHTGAYDPDTQRLVWDDLPYALQ